MGGKSDFLAQTAAEPIAKVATHGGASLAGGSLLAWLNGNTGAVVAICAIVGATCSVIGLLFQLRSHWRRTHGAP